MQGYSHPNEFEGSVLMPLKESMKPETFIDFMFRLSMSLFCGQFSICRVGFTSVSRFEDEGKSGIEGIGSL